MKKTVKRILAIMLVVVMTIGAAPLSGFVGFELPEFITKAAGYLTNICTPISILIIGALIATQSPKRIFCSWKLYYFNAIIKEIQRDLDLCLM